MERDGGIYIEIEAIALSRDIPGSVRWFVEPIVRNVSRQSLKTSLQQTGRGVRASRIQVAMFRFSWKWNAGALPVR
jgi:hypothetical protein